MENRASHDQALVARALQGDAEAFGELVAAYQNMVAAVAWRYGTPRSEVEDVVSEVFVKLHRNLHQYRPDHPFSTWLYRLAGNLAVDQGRRRRKESGRTEMPEQLRDPSPGAGESVERRERAEILRASLAEVPDHYRDALYLVYLEGKSIREAADQLGVPTGTLKTRLMRGREALRRILVRRNPEHFGESDAM